jgi:hypothetical protein
MVAKILLTAVIITNIAFLLIKSLDVHKVSTSAKVIILIVFFGGLATTIISALIAIWSE